MVGGRLDISGATGINGDFDINSNKFKVFADSGNTTVAGTLGVTGDITGTLVGQSSTTASISSHGDTIKGFFSAGTGVTYNLDGDGEISIGQDVSTTSNVVFADIECVEIITTSDMTFKRDITVLDNSLSKIQKLQGCTYKWRTEEYPNRGFDDELQIGFMAQDVESVVPEVVKQRADGYKGIAYDKLTALLVEGMKEQQNTIECLKEEVNELKNNSDSISLSDGASSYETPNSNISDTKIDELELDNECLKNEVCELRDKFNLIMSKLN